MEKVETTNGYDIYELSEDECEEAYYCHPCFAVVFEGEDIEIGCEETTEGSLEEAQNWCERYSRN